MKRALPEIAGYYSRMQILTASRPKTICMLHEVCLSRILRARTDRRNRTRSLNNAQNILVQLQAALNTGDNLGQSLFLLYDYCYIQLEIGTDEACDNAVEILADLRTALAMLLKTM